MDLVVAALVGCVAMGGLVLVLVGYRRRRATVSEPLIPAGMTAILSALPSPAVLVGQRAEVLRATPPAHALGLVRGNRVAVPAFADLVGSVTETGQLHETDVVLYSGRPPEPRHLHARAVAVGHRLVLLTVDDRTAARRVEAIRRDFVANVSHELKTPAGALALLAEAVSAAAEDPDAVRRFASRMDIESVRLGRLVQQIVDLSRLQSDAPPEVATPASVDEVLDEALDRCRVEAESRQIDLVRVGERGLKVRGDAAQLSIAVGNLVENAVIHSRDGGRVAVGATSSGDNVEVTVTDQGPGIPSAELGRIFERFYRLDPARSRATGGGGLGLAIVKHIVAGHGGDVRVWSVVDEGSSFTLRLPADGVPEPAE